MSTSYSWTCCSSAAASCGPSVYGHRDEVLDGHRVEHLAAEALGDDAGADALAGGVDRGRGAGRAAADHEHVEGLLGRRSSRPRAPSAPVSSLATICSQRHAALAERLAVQEDGRHGHDLARLDLVLEQRAVDRGVADFGLSTVIRFSACTTSGQFWQVSEK